MGPRACLPIASILLSMLLYCVSSKAAVSESVRTAVVLENEEGLSTYSKFFNQLRERGHSLTFDFGNATKAFLLEKYDEKLYDHLILMSSDIKATRLTAQNLMDFLEKGGNILLSANTHLSKDLRKFSLQCGVAFSSDAQVVLDHVARVDTASNLDNSAILASDLVSSSHIVGTAPATGKPIAFYGLGTIIDGSSILAFHVLNAPSTAYLCKWEGGSCRKSAYGSVIGLVTAVQARNNARVIFSGSMELFSDRYFTSDFANKVFVNSVSKWGFQEMGVLRMSNVHHQREDGSQPDRMLKNTARSDQPITLYPDAEIARDSLVYRVSDNLTFSMDIHEFRDGKWNAFMADDVQLEFVMLDPYVRRTMSHDKKGHYSITFQAPDQYGIFLFRVMYRRLGLSTLFSTTQVSVRPYKHDEYERFIPTAFPYYFSAFSMMAGVLMLTVYFLFHEERK
uniref:Dolichyl-diphosphooligosaccharide--protein glycosyltransferase 48 kDa subunit n=1 Tax=Albugo laibachii Nc14 TaxID=890382 RepID=F0W8E7_9STRA|nr:putative dolichyldiphosphooligosaccharideprotein glycosyltransferase 48kD subunit [Albugo laibachii Nc14]|eukprot:CCA17402.1 putative dolichyldiphosphooligosaccharideprotein glycosyltransferase 48kD subunit [Albugo laibachii Nc14]